MANIQITGPSVQVRGMVPDLERALMGDGQFILLQNARCDDGLIEARRKESSIIAAPSWATAQAPLGSDAVTVNGNEYEIAVWADGSKARIAVLPSTLDRWVEVTGSGQWTGTSGNNRLGDIDNFCQITLMRSPRLRTTSGTFASRDIVLIQNGEDYPRIWDPDTPNYTSYTVTGAAASSGKIRLTIGAGHNFQTGDHAYVSNVGGVSAATGLWQVTRVSSTVIELDGSTFAGSFTSGGTVLDKADLLVHKPVNDESAVGDSFAGPDSYAPIVGGASTTYTGTSGAVQTTDFQFSDAATAPYTGTNSVIDWDITTAAAADDIATVQFSTPITLGSHLLMLIEGASGPSALKQAKIEFNTENVGYTSIAVAWVTALDPTGADASKKQFEVVLENTTANRYWIIIDTRQLAGTIAYHMRFTRQGPAPAANQQIYILAMGAVTGDIPASTQWGFHYEDPFNLVEQRFHVMRARGDNVGTWGGPQYVNSGTATVTSEAPNFPLIDTLAADFHFTLTNADGAAAIDGGLDGVPSKIAVYGKRPDDDTYWWLFSGALYAQGYNAGVRSWAKSDTSNTVVSVDLPSNVTQELFNTNREAPSADHIPIPIGAVTLYANQRLLVGNVKDATDQYAKSDYYFSWDRNPLRFQHKQEDELRGAYSQVAGEEIKAFRASTAAAFGAGRIFLWTNKWLYTLGESGPFAESGISASDLGRPVRVAPHGTLSPRSVAVGYGAMVWVDHDSQLMRMGSGVPVNIGRKTIANRLDQSVASRKPYISTAFRKDRFYIAYTPGLETLNERVLVWNENMQAIESEDYETTGPNFEQLHTYSQAAGSFSNTRLFFYGSNGTLYAYAEDNSGTIALRFASREYQFKGWDGWFVKECQAMITSQSATVSISRVSRMWGADEAWGTTMSINKSGADFAVFRDTNVHTKTGTDRGTETDWAWYVDVSMTVAPETKVLRFEFDATQPNVSIGERT